MYAMLFVVIQLVVVPEHGNILVVVNDAQCS